jgi:hypothetical protein
MSFNSDLVFKDQWKWDTKIFNRFIKTFLRNFLKVTKFKDIRIPKKSRTCVSFEIRNARKLLEAINSPLLIATKKIECAKSSSLLSFVSWEFDGKIVKLNNWWFCFKSFWREYYKRSLIFDEMFWKFEFILRRVETQENFDGFPNYDRQKINHCDHAITCQESHRIINKYFHR